MSDNKIVLSETRTIDYKLRVELSDIGDNIDCWDICWAEEWALSDLIAKLSSIAQKATLVISDQIHTDIVNREEVMLAIRALESLHSAIRSLPTYPFERGRSYYLNAYKTMYRIVAADYVEES